MAAIFCGPAGFRSLSVFVHHVKVLWFRQLRQRFDRASTSELLDPIHLLAGQSFLVLRGVQPWPHERFLAVHTRGRRRVRLREHLDLCEEIWATGAHAATRGLEKRGLNRVIAELCWRDFLYTPNCTGEGAGIPFVEVPPAGTSQACSRCGPQVPKALSERIHRRGVCGLELDRDENTARNMGSRGLRIFEDAAAACGTAPGAPAASAAR